MQIAGICEDLKSKKQSADGGGKATSAAVCDGCEKREEGAEASRSRRLKTVVEKCFSLGMRTDSNLKTVM